MDWQSDLSKAKVHDTGTARQVADSATTDERRGSGKLGTVRQQSSEETVTRKRRNLKVLCVFMNVPPLLAAATRQARRQIISQNVVAHKWTKASITKPNLA
jgi:hypothetical protein